MTYAELLEALQTLTPDQLNQTATVHLCLTDEYAPILCLDKTTENCDVLDSGHIIMKLDY